MVDVNGNVDSWNNVSPFEDNGNGAYPANPNLEQYYGYGGAWGYLYFNGVLGGTNTVRSVDMYYIHGRWWHPDMGIFLSPNAKGDYLFGGDGPPGQRLADWVWMAWSGGVCRFVDNEFLGTIAFSDKLSEILTGGRAGTWYGETCVDYQDEAAYQVGSHFGDAASIGISIWEVGVGSGGAGLGVLGAPETGGGSLALTAGGGALALHGAGVGGTVLVKNLTGAAQEIFSFAQGTQRDPRKINITESGLKHVLDRHAFGAKYPDKSQFLPGEDIASLIRQSESVSPTAQSRGTLQRIVDAGRIIGIDGRTGQSTSIYTVITDAAGNLITAFPGSP